MKLIDMHSHWGTQRGYVLRTAAELAQQKKTWNSETKYVTEEEMVAYFRASNAQVILDLGFTKFAPVQDIRPLHDYSFDMQRQHPVEFHVVVGLLMFGGRVDGRVHGVEGDIHEPRLDAALGDAFQGFGGDELGGVTFFVEEFPVAVPGVLVGITFAIFVRPRIRRAGESAVARVETVGVRNPFRSGAEMPLAGEVRTVAGGLERRGERGRAEGHRA